jgi:uncharacterized membrane protein
MPDESWFQGGWQMILFWTLLIIGTLLIGYLLIRNNSEEDRFLPLRDSESAEELLDKRYARDEITKDIYDEMKQDLG